MVINTQRAAANKPAKIPMPVVSFGEGIPYAAQIMEQASVSNSLRVNRGSVTWLESSLFFTA